MTDWKRVTGDHKPAELDTATSNYVVYERKNIEQVEVDDGMSEGGKSLMWQYDEREMTVEEYQQMRSPFAQGIMQTLSSIELTLAFMQ